MKKILLLILDGFGYREEEHGNAIKRANMKNFNALWEKYPHSVLEASGEAVGLPNGFFGNSEVCHEAIGVGKKLKQDITIALDSFLDRTIEDNPRFIRLISHVKDNDSTLHLMGLLSNGGVHSHIDYMKQLIPILKEKGVTKIVFHAITDGRDTPPDESVVFIREMDNLLKSEKIGYIGTVCGRFYAMDRDNNWERIGLYSDLILKGRGVKVLNYETAIKNCYRRGLSDEVLPPLILNEDSIIKEHDA